MGRLTEINYKAKILKLIKPYLIFTVLVWLPWGLICTFDLASIEEIIGVSSAIAHGKSDIRAMYGGAQTAIGLMALLALFKPRYFPNVVFTLAFLASGLALSRSYGLWTDGGGDAYTWGVVSYEYFAAITSMIWLALLPGMKAGLEAGSN